jgi:hypothetical protein
MKKNLAGFDRIGRVLIAVLIAVLYFTNVVSGTLGIVLLILGAVFVVTAILDFCPIYWILGLSTKKQE